MRSKTTYKEILILSTKEEKSKKVEFTESKNIVFGINDTGKSTLIKMLFWALGLSPSKLFGGNRFDKNAIALLTLDYDGEIFYFFRQADSRILFNKDKTQLFKTESNSKWQAYLSKMFDYHLTLAQRKDLKEYPVGLHGLLTPYYIDQDVGWSHKWDGPFESMHRYYEFYPQVIQYFTGITSKEIVNLDIKKRKLVKQQKDLEFKERLYNDSASELLEKKEQYSLEPGYPDMDKKIFKKIITEATLDLKESQEKQFKFKHDLSEIFNQKQITLNLLKNAYILYDQILGDINHVKDIPENSVITCPICNTEHANALDGLIELELGLEGVRQNIFNLKETLNKLKSDEDSLTRDLKVINEKIDNFTKKFEYPISIKYTFEDVIKFYSNHKIKQNIEKNIEKINFHSRELNFDIEEIDKDIKKISHDYKANDITQKVKSAIEIYYKKLEVDAKSPPLQVYYKSDLSGSSNPRSVLALHLAYITQSYQNTTLPIFPIVIDTIQQNGQDDFNMSNTIKVISEFSLPQVILGMETLPINIDKYNFNIITLTNEKYSLLNRETYYEDLKKIETFFKDVQFT